MRRPLFWGALLAPWVLVGFLAAELDARARGAQPYPSSTSQLRVTPGVWAQPDPDYGWTLRDGAYTFAGGEHAVVATHESGHRVTPPSRGRVLELHGGSFAYGFGLADEQALGWQLQERLPDHDVRSRAAPGYGPLQAWQALQAHIDAGTRPYAMLVAYVGFQDERVTWNRSWREALSGSRFAKGLAGRMPTVRTKQGPPVVELVDPREGLLPGGRWSAALAERSRAASEADEQQLESSVVARNLLVQMHHRAKEHGTHVLVVGLCTDPTTQGALHDLRGHGVLTLDAGLDCADPAHQLWPHDPHPNAAAAAHWADAIADLVLHGPSVPRPEAVSERAGEVQVAASAP